MDETTESDATFPVRMQLAAYNAKDIDAFMKWWAVDCQYYAFPDRLLANGAAEIRARHVARFTEPNLFAALVNRIAAGNLVVDQEIVTRDFPDGTGELDVVAIYQIEKGKIAKAWFSMGEPRPRPRETVVIRAATAADIEIVGFLTREAYAKWIPVIGREPMPMKADFAEAVMKHHVDLLYFSGAPAAMIEMIPQADHLLIENIAVLPEFQRQGLGRQLLAHAEKRAAALGYDETRLYTNPLFAGNVALYQTSGYAIFREEEFKGGITVHMRKSL